MAIKLSLIGTDLLRKISELLVSAPLSKKRGTILSLENKAFLVFHPEFHKKNLEFVIKTLINNDYPFNVIFKVMTNKVKYLINENTKKQEISTVNFTNKHQTIK